MFEYGDLDSWAEDYILSRKLEEALASKEAEDFLKKLAEDFAGGSGAFHPTWQRPAHRPALVYVLRLLQAVRKSHQIFDPGALALHRPGDR